MRGNVVLDPYTAVCKLALLDFYPEGTKLVIEDNDLTFSRPTSAATVWRSICSLFVDTQSYSRNSLFNLRKPIARAVTWYRQVCPTVFRHACKGLERLIDIYDRTGDGGNASETLRYCLLTMREHESVPSLLHVPGDDLRDKLLEELKRQWSDREVQCIETWFAEMADSNIQERHIMTIETFLRLKQPQLHDIIRGSAI